MKLGVVVDGHWGFIRELLSDWETHFEPEVFGFKDIRLPLSQGRVNQWRLKRSLKQFIDKNDAIFFEWAGPLTTVASHLPLKTPLVVRLHSWELYEFAPRIRWQSVSRIVLVSESMQQKFGALYPEAVAKTSVVNNGVSLSRFRPEGHVLTGNIGMLCNIIPIKRVYEAVLMLHELRKEASHLKLHIGGEPGEGSEGHRYITSIRRAVEKLSLQDRVVFHGQVNDVPNWLRNVDIFVSNSYWEGQQVALIEAMASGCYCLSHFWDGAEEVLPKDNLFATDSELKKKILEYCGQPADEKRARQQQMHLIACEKFDVERTKRQMRAVINGVVA